MKLLLILIALLLPMGVYSRISRAEQLRIAFEPRTASVYYPPEVDTLTTLVECYHSTCGLVVKASTGSVLLAVRKDGNYTIDLTRGRNLTFEINSAYVTLESLCKGSKLSYSRLLGESFGYLIILLLSMVAFFIPMHMYNEISYDIIKN